MKTKYLNVVFTCCTIHVLLVKTTNGNQQQEQQQDEEGVKHYKLQTNLDQYEDFVQEEAEDCRKDTHLPIILWWTPFTGVLGLSRSCTFGSCCFTQDRTQIHRDNVKLILFYGTDFEPTDLPLPRRKGVWWGLLHEESPKNRPVLNHLPVVQLFNLTGTFKWKSDFPLTLQFLPSIDSLTSREIFIPTRKKNKFLEGYFISGKGEERQNTKTKATESKDSDGGEEETVDEQKDGNEKSFTKLAPLVYIHSDCDTPSERDRYVMELSKYIKIDSLGDCLNTRTLPLHIRDASHFNHLDVWHILARYKFTLTVENYGCEDYITEKFWRPLIVGSVPVYWGSPSIADWAPNSKSVIKISDFSNPKELADYLHLLLKNDSLYEAHLTHKTRGEVTNAKLIEGMNERQWGLDDLEKGSFIDHYECYVCDEIYRSHPHLTARTSYEEKIADTSHIKCPAPKAVLTNSVNKKSHWLEEYVKSETEAEVLGDFLKYNRPFSDDEFYTKVFERLRAKEFFHRFPLRHDEL